MAHIICINYDKFDIHVVIIDLTICSIYDFIDSHIERINRELQEVCTTGGGRGKPLWQSCVQPIPTKQDSGAFC